MATPSTSPQHDGQPVLDLGRWGLRRQFEWRERHVGNDRVGVELRVLLLRGLERRQPEDNGVLGIAPLGDSDRDDLQGDADDDRHRAVDRQSGHCDPGQLDQCDAGFGFGADRHDPFTVFGPQSSAPTSCSTGGTPAGTSTVSGNGTVPPVVRLHPFCCWRLLVVRQLPGRLEQQLGRHRLRREHVRDRRRKGVSGTHASSDLRLAASAPRSRQARYSHSVLPARVPTGTITFTVFGPQARLRRAAPAAGPRSERQRSPVTAPTTRQSCSPRRPSATTGGTPPTAETRTTTPPPAPAARGCRRPSSGRPRRHGDRDRPVDGTIGTAIAASSISSVLASGYSPTGHDHLHGLRPAGLRPDELHERWHHGRNGDRLRQRHLPPVGRLHPDLRRQLLVVRLLRRRLNNNTAAEHLRLGHVRDRRREGLARRSPPTGPATGDRRHGHRRELDQLRRWARLQPDRHDHLQGLRPAGLRPDDLHDGGTTVGTATVSGNATYHPSAGYTPTAAGNYWWYASYGGDSNNNPAASTCGSGMSETVVAKATPTADRDRAVHRRPRHSDRPRARSALRSLGLQPDRHDHLHGLRPAVLRTDDLHHRRHDGRHGDPSRATAPTTRRRATRRPPPATTGGTPSYGGDTNNNSAASTCGSGMSETVVAKASPSITATGPAAGNVGTAIAASSISSALCVWLQPDRHHHRSPSSVRRRPPRPPARPAARRSAPLRSRATAPTTRRRHTRPRRRQLLVVRLLRRRLEQQLAASTCGSGMTETVVAQASADTHRDRPRNRHGRHRDRRDLDQLASWRRAQAPTGTITFTVFGPQSSAPTTCTTGGTTVGTATVSGNSTYNSSAATRRLPPATTGGTPSYGGDIEQQHRPRAPAARACPRRWSQRLRRR